MIATLVLRALLASLAFVLAAYCAERGLRSLRLPTRWSWLGALAAIVAMPVAQWIALSLPSAAVDSGKPFELAAILTTTVLQRFNDSTLRDLDRLLLGFWLVGSFATIVRLVLASRVLRTRAKDWRQAQLSGVNVWLSDQYGPAVVGVGEPEIVMPRRMLDLPPQEQQLALAHELEHIAAKDQWLARGAALAVAIVPWNPCAWFATRRLRSAMEIDCDARVLQRKPNAADYASLVLTVASWSRRSSANALALGESAITQLERRLRLMTTMSNARRPGISALFLTSALALAFYACRAAVDVDKPEPRIHELPAVLTSATTTAQPFSEFQVDKPATPHEYYPPPLYPRSLRENGIEGQVLVQFVVGTDGRVDLSTLKVVTATHDLFVQAIRDVLPQMKFNPAEVKGTKVKQLVQLPFAFAIAR